jgi:hypothetical protein
MKFLACKDGTGGCNYGFEFLAAANPRGFGEEGLYGTGCDPVSLSCLICAFDSLSGFDYCLLS